VIFWQLLKTDLVLFLQNIKDKFINLVIWTTATTVVAGYVLQAFGVSESFGAFQACGIIISAIGFELYGQLFSMVADMTGPRNINYYLTLPVSNFVVFSAKATFISINGFILSILMLPLCKLILMKKLILATINYPKFLLTLVVTNIFFGWFTLWLTSFVEDLVQADNVLMRILFPLWIFGCYQYSLKVAYAISPLLAAISIISPYSFATEALRSAMLGPADYIPFWVSILALCIMSGLVSFSGYHRLKAKLDFI
jgi:hypothetical protein